MSNFGDINYDDFSNDHSTDSSTDYSTGSILYYRYEEEARAYANEFGIDTRIETDNAWDAFRHAYASAEMTREYGEYVANFAGWANEVKGDITYDQSVNARNMDEFNNAVGREIGKESTSSRDSANKVLEALNQGQLITDP